MILYLCVLIVFSLHRESLKLILVMNPSPRWFCHNGVLQNHRDTLGHERPLACCCYLVICLVVLMDGLDDGYGYDYHGY
jgi:hypothetical protein